MLFGCYAEVSKEEISKISEVDLVLGNNEKSNIKNILDNYFSNKEVEFEYKDEFLEFGSITYTEKTRAVIKVQDGCNQFCSYCIIPYARGRIRSRDKEAIINEVTQMANKRNKRSSYNRDSCCFVWKRFE